MKNFKTTDEVLKEIGVSRALLKEWERDYCKFHYRYRQGRIRVYSEEQIWRLKLIKTLSYDVGLTSKGLYKLLVDGIRTYDLVSIKIKGKSQ